MTPYEERLCRTCKYGKKPEYYKPCGALYRDDCRLYEPIEEMTPKKAIIQLEYLKNNGFKTKEQFEALDLASKLLKQQPQRPKGKWVEDIDYLDGVNFPDVRFYCSECKSMAYRKSVYCPNCGAKMEVEE